MAGAAAGLMVGCVSSSDLLTDSMGEATGALDPTAIANCRQLLVRLDVAVEAAGVRDAQSVRVPGFAYLRVDRFERAVMPAPDDIMRFDAWVERLLILDREAREHELANLPAASVANLGLGSRVELGADEARCGRQLLAHDLQFSNGPITNGPITNGHTTNGRERLAQSIRVPDAYDGFKRLLGLYPLVSLPFAAGVDRYHARVRETFAMPLDGFEPRGASIRFVPPIRPRLPSAEVTELMTLATENSSRLPTLTVRQREQLFDAFAPVFQVDVADDNDRIGVATLRRREPQRWVDVSRAAVYRKLSYTRFDEKNLIQLNYVIWFPSRPKRGGLDLLGGHLDGLTLRITLDERGRPLMYDAMHNCGCYHLFAPTARLRRREGARLDKYGGSVYEEPPLVLDRLAKSLTPGVEEAARLVVHIASGTHHLQRLYLVGSESDRERVGTRPATYQLRDYAELRSLPRPGGGSASWFGPDGLVAGSERGERWLFWPMGIASPGAMRQWGSHAIAFVGRRHFDDADLIERYFELVE